MNILLTRFWLFLFLMPAFTSLIAQNQPPAQTFPKFTFYKTNNEVFTNANIKPGTPVIVVFFDPDCDHCQQMASWLNADAKNLISRKIQVMFVSTAETKDIHLFHKERLAALGNNAFCLKDKNYKFDSYFGYSVAPTIYTYGSNGKLVKVFKKDVPVAELLTGLK